ncbi:MAG TPA: ABC transporter permease [Solirubrobacterales bacterium]|nr:ABC transporter permease [Solirubrobacterales bacterium]
MTDLTVDETTEPRLAARVGNAFRSLFSDGLLLVVLIALIVFFSLLLPDTFPTTFNMRSILSEKSVILLMALGLALPLVTNQFDLSVGYVLCLSHILMIGLQVRTGLSWPLAALLVLLAGAAIGLVNGLLVTKAQINSFIATLGSGTAIYGVALWYTHGEQVVGNISPGFIDLSGTTAGIPRAALYALVACFALWILLEYLPVGRHLYVTGANPRAAELLGLPTQRYTIAAFIGSSTLTALAGIILASQLGVGQITVGPEYLLPAFAAVLLGATVFKRGRVNVWGTVVAVLLLAVTVSGLQQLGAQSWVDPLFNGLMLIVAVGVAGWVSRLRAAAGRD